MTCSPPTARQAWRNSPWPACARPRRRRFGLREVTFPAWTLAAFAIGVLAGMLIRRVVPAIVATLVVYAGLAFVTVGSCASTT